MPDGHYVVVAVAQPSPAAGAGLKVGDEIVELNGKMTDILSQATLDELKTGAPGTVITMTIRHGRENELHRMEIRTAELL